MDFVYSPLSRWSAYAFGMAMGLFVAVHGTADQWHGGHPVRGAQPVHAPGGIVFLFLNPAPSSVVGWVATCTTTSAEVIKQLSILAQPAGGGGSAGRCRRRWRACARRSRCEPRGWPGLAGLFMLLLALAWWGWSRAGLALLQLNMSLC